MSKSNMLLGLAKGKVGDLVFYRDGGEQRTRTRVIPKNPRTPAQMAQRVRMANVSAIFRLLSPILKESFTGRPSNQSGFNAFASMAIPASPFMTKEMATADVVLPMPCFVSKGVLSPVDLGTISDGGDVYPSIFLPDADTEGSTLGGVSRVLIARYPSIKNGDKITQSLIIFKPTGEPVDGVQSYKTSVYTKSVVIDTTSTDTLTTIGVKATADGISLVGGASLQSTDVAMCATLISRINEGGSLETSTQSAWLSTSAETLYESYRTDAALNNAVQSYMAGAESILR